MKAENNEKEKITEINYCPYCGKKLPQKNIEEKLDPSEMRKIQEIRDILKDVDAGRKKIVQKFPGFNEYVVLTSEDAMQSTGIDYTEKIMAELSERRKT